jgi:hypothetical protein
VGKIKAFGLVKWSNWLSIPDEQKIWVQIPAGFKAFWGNELSVAIVRK